jgi:hypothetical protein
MQSRMDVPRASARIIVACLAVVCATACDDTPEPPDMTPAPVEDVTGTERIGWMQSASDAVELSTFGYAIYVDGVRSELAGVACQKTAASPDFECSAPLPELSPGVHTLELAAFVVDGQLLESARSAPIQVNRTSAATTLAPPAPGPGSPGQAPPAGSPGTQPLVAPDGQRLRLETIAEGLARPTDLAFLPDGRVLVAEGRRKRSRGHPGRPDAAGPGAHHRTGIERNQAVVHCRRRPRHRLCDLRQAIAKRPIGVHPGELP